jgi:hypothetical protein
MYLDSNEDFSVLMTQSCGRAHRMCGGRQFAPHGQ